MSLSKELMERSGGRCELCGSNHEVICRNVPPKYDDRLDEQIAICGVCDAQINGDQEMDTNHWRCLNDVMWSEHQPVQVMSYQLLDRLSDDDWARDAKEMMYLDDEADKWAKAGILAYDNKVVHLDSNGTVLNAGDNVVLIQDLNVKGAGFTAKRGTAVRRISLVSDNATQIEGKVNGQRIVILTQYVKKS